METSSKTYKPYTCEICGKTFGRYQYLYIHKKIHSEKKPFTCEICGASFRLKEHLKRHRYKHTEEKPFECKLCFQKYKSKDYLSIHIKTVHTNERPYECPVCDKTFTSALLRNQHKVIHFEKKYQCEVCGKKFHRKQGLRVHMNNHGFSKDKFLNSSSSILPKNDQNSDDSSDTANEQEVENIFHHKEENEAEGKENIQDISDILDEEVTLGNNTKENEQSKDQNEVKIQKPVINDRIFNCEFCKKTFNSQGYLFRHQNQFHRHMMKKNLPQGVYCQLCTSKRFTNIHYFRRHVNKFHQNVDHVTRENLYFVIKEDNTSENTDILNCVNEEGKDKQTVATAEGRDSDSRTEEPDEIAVLVKVEEENCPINAIILNTENDEDLVENDSSSCDKMIKNINQACTEVSNVLNSKIVGRVSFVLPEDDKNSNYVTCVHCLKPFQNKSDLKRHNFFMHKAESAIFDNSTDSKNVINRVSKIVCEICGKEFSNFGYLKRHVLKFHPAHKDDFKKHKDSGIVCHVCNVNFSDIGYLKRHNNKYHKDVQSKPINPSIHECDVCHKEFQRKYCLIKHKYSHLKLKPFQCEHCKYRFASKLYLDIHIRSVHTNEKPYACTVCDKRFYSSMLKYQHMAVHREKRFQCYICYRKFRRKQHVKYHFRTNHRSDTYDSGRVIVRKTSNTITKNGSFGDAKNDSNNDICLKKNSIDFDSRLDPVPPVIVLPNDLDTSLIQDLNSIETNSEDIASISETDAFSDQNGRLTSDSEKTAETKLTFMKNPMLNLAPHSVLNHTTKQKEPLNSEQGHGPPKVKYGTQSITKCKVCSTIFSNESELIDHLYYVHIGLDKNDSMTMVTEGVALKENISEENGIKTQHDDRKLSGSQTGIDDNRVSDNDENSIS